MSDAAAGRGGSEGGKGAGACKRCGVEGQVMQCSKCHKAHYCGPGCQKEDWKEHKKVCPQLAQEYAAEKLASAAARDQRGQFEGSRRQIEKALQVEREHKGRESEMGANLLMLGHVLRAQGRYIEALEKYEEALGVFQKLVDVEGTDPGKRNFHRCCMSSALEGIGGVHLGQTEYGLALQKLQEARQIQIEVLGPDGPDSESLELLGNVYSRQGKYKEALKSYKEALRIGKKKFGAEHANVAGALNNIGIVRLNQGQLPKALANFTEALRIFRQTLGRDHPNIAISLRNIGNVYNELGRPVEAVQALEEALGMQRKMLGEDHQDVAGTQFYLDMAHGGQVLSTMLGGRDRGV